MKPKLFMATLTAVIVVGSLGAGAGGNVVTAQAARTNVVIDWNVTMVATVTTAKVAGAPATRIGAIVQAAVFDALNGIDRRYKPIHVAPAAPEDASRPAAVASAAYTSLVALYPDQKPALDAALAASLADAARNHEGEDQSVADGVAWGKSVADQILAWRATDGFNSSLPPYVVGTAPGDWRPTPPGFVNPPLFRTLAVTSPFGLTSPSQFRPAGPPALTSAQYAADFNEVKDWGGATSSLRTTFQAETATFWAADTPTGIWNRVADALAMKHHKNLLATARLLAMLNLSEADAGFAIWEAKNTFNTWRPVTAIAAADPSQNWKSLLTTPAFQEYPSGHSGASGAALAVLSSTFGAGDTFTVTSSGLPNVTRTFSNYSDAAAQVADARVFAGIHFRFACTDANAVGVNVANYLRQTLMLRNSNDENSSDEGGD